MMTGDKIIDTDVFKKAVVMAKNQKRMREVWADVVSGPDENDPAKYIAALVCLSHFSHAQVEVLAGVGDKLKSLVQFAKRCVAEVEALEREGK